jgi:hypothetical protein
MELEQQEPQTTLRDDIAATLETYEAPASDGVAPDAAVETAAPEGETAAQREERIRDEKGRFASAPETPETVPEVAPVSPKYTRPSTWKKETWGIWDKLNSGAVLTPEEIHLMAQEAVRRDQDFAKGVSTYKHEADSAKELRAAIEPFMPDLQQHGIQPSQWISQLGNAHQMLARGTPQQKLQMFSKLAQDYGVPLNAIGAPQEQQQPAQEMMQYVQPVYEQVNQLRGQFQAIQSFQQQQEQQRINQEITRFSADKPHFEQVKDTMARLLETGFAKDLQDAYERAVRQPEHDDIFQAMQQQQREAESNRAAELQRETVARARKQTTSVRSGAPSAPRAKQSGQSDLRAALTEAVESHATGRV